jgi:hypothetical protein
MRRLRFALMFAGVLLVAFSFPVFSQSCSLCYTQAASASAKLIAALRSGILVLLITPMFLSVGILYLAYSKRNQFKHDTSEEKPDW